MSIPLGDLVEQEIGNRYNQGAGNQTIAQELFKELSNLEN